LPYKHCLLAGSLTASLDLHLPSFSKYLLGLLSSHDTTPTTINSTKTGSRDDPGQDDLAQYEKISRRKERAGKKLKRRGSERKNKFQTFIY
jgi:hypothetical protein